MQKPAARTGILVLAVVVATLVGWAVFVPDGSWPALAWTALACAGAVWVAKRSIRSTRSMSVSSLMIWLGWYDLPRPPEVAYTRPGWLPLRRSTAADMGRVSVPPPHHGSRSLA